MGLFGLDDLWGFGLKEPVPDGGVGEMIWNGLGRESTVCHSEQFVR